jgi:hypothetical protein
MPVYSVEGKLGTGKTKFAVWRATEAIRTGRRVASNVDLQLDVIAKPGTRPSYIRVPDKPTGDDLAAIGHGNPESYDEDRNGVLLLDELGTWLNSRSFQDKSRAGVLDWLIHARKFGWDVYLIVQDANMIDKQIRESLIEYQCKCMRADKVRIPLIGGLINDAFGGRWGYFPRAHLVAARLGSGQGAVVAERWVYRGEWLHKAYDTRQSFTTDYPHGAHSVLHPRFFEAPDQAPTWRQRLGLVPYAPGQAQAPAKPAARPKHPHVQALMLLPPDERVKAARRIVPLLEQPRIPRAVA